MDDADARRPVADEDSVEREGMRAGHLAAFVGAVAVLVSAAPPTSRTS